jgi:hypothetical protein
MILYHGGLEEIKKPNIETGRSNVDFGKGFYLTDIREQAIRWINRRKMQMKRGIGFLNIYEHTNISSLNTKEFDGYNEEWLDFVIANRTNNSPEIIGDYDIVVGNVADDEVVVAIDTYIEQLNKGRTSEYSKPALLAELKFSRPNSQYAFRTEKSLSAIKYLSAEKI